MRASPCWQQLTGHKYGEAEALFKRVVELRTQSEGLENSETLLTMANLEDLYGRERKFSESESLWRRCYELRLRLSGAQDWNTLAYQSMLGIVYAHEKQYQKGRALFDEAVHTTKSRNPDALSTVWYNYACFEAVSGRKGKAFEDLQTSLRLATYDVATMDTDPSLVSMHSDPRFAALIAQARQRMAQETAAIH